MFALLQSEWYKLRKSKILSLIFVGPLIGLFLGLAIDYGSDPEVNEWYVTLLYDEFNVCAVVSAVNYRCFC